MRNILFTYELKKAFDLYQCSKNINLTKSYGNDFNDYDVIMTGPTRTIYPLAGMGGWEGKEPYNARIRAQFPSLSPPPQYIKPPHRARIDIDRRVSDRFSITKAF